MHRGMILAAGLGSRLHPLTAERSKPVVPLAGRPLIWFALDHYRRAGIDGIAINVHHLAGTVRSALDRCAEAHDVTFTVFEETALLGTGGGIRNARSVLDGDAPFVVMNADVLFAPDLANALAVHREHDAIATMVLRRTPDPDRFGSIEIDRSGRVRRLLGSPETASEPLEKLMFTGVHVLSPRALDALPEDGCIVRHAYRRWVDEGEVVAGVVDDGPWADLGTHTAYLDANIDLACGRRRWPGIVPGVAAAATVAAGAVVDDAIVEAATLGADVVVRRAVVGAGAEIAAGVTVEDAVVWDGAQVTSDVRRAIATPTQIVPVP